MTSRVRALVEADLLVWARDSAGFSLDDAAKKAQVTPERLLSWEEGEDRPTINQLRTLGRIYKRPIAAFYLPERPTDFMAMRDYRRIPGVRRGEESSELRFEIRRAEYRREVALELAESWDEDVPYFDASASLSETPELVAERARETLGVSVEKQANWSSPSAALNSWRFALEDAGVLVFQASEVEVKEMRGFSLTERPLPVVAINNKDTRNGRIFSLMHELAHLMLKDSGLCVFNEQPSAFSQGDVELFCNRVAAAILVPKDDLFSQPSVIGKGRSAIWVPEDLWSLSARYGVSHEVLLRRLFSLGRVDEEYYWSTIGSFGRKRSRGRSGSSGGWQPQAEKAVYNAGQLFSELVLENFHEERIGAGDVSDYFETRLKHLPAIEELVRKRARQYRQESSGTE